MARARTQDMQTGGQRLDATLSSAGDVAARLRKACAPAAPVSVAPANAVGAFAAADIVALADAPASSVAVMDGRAASSLELIGATSMSPAFASGDLPLVRVGHALPANYDCVIDAALVVEIGPGLCEVHASAAPGDGVRRAGEDMRRGDIIAPAGARVSPAHVVALAAQGTRAIAVRRPKVRIVATPAGHDATARFIASIAREDGADVEFVGAEERSAQSIATAFSADFDAALVVGGTGAGADDHAINALRATGDLLAHGLALDPGRTGAAGLIRQRPVMCLPGRFDGALAVYLALAQPILRFIAGAGDPPALRAAALTRKISSTVGVAQVVLLSFDGARWIPLCVGDVTLSHLLRAHACLIIPEGSEGYAEGAVVEPHPLPGRSQRP